MTTAKKIVFPIQQVEFNHNIPAVKAKLTLLYVDALVDKIEEIIDDDFTTGWKAPADATFQLCFPGLKANLDNSWTRDGSLLSKAGLNIDSVKDLSYHVLIDEPWSVKGFTAVNPFPYPVFVTARHMAADESTVVGSTQTWQLGPYQSKPFDISALTISNKTAGASKYLSLSISLYNSVLPMNYIVISDAKTGIYLNFPDSNEEGVPFGPSIALDCYNLIDQYGVGIAGVAAMFTGVELAYSALAGTSTLRSLAQAAGIGAGELAGIIIFGIYEGWLDMDDATRLLIPALGVAVSPIAGQAMMSGLASKYTGMGAGLLQLAAGGAAVAGSLASAWVLINMIDDIVIYTEA